MKIFTIRDSKSDIYNSPFYARTHGEAERHFVTLCNDPESMVYKFKDDFDLYCLGDWDEINGVIETKETPEHLLKAINVVQKDS